jgi:hypothetical protein
MSNERPITPPPELVRHWSRFQGDTDSEALWFRIANEAAQWGADQELEASVSWLIENQNPRWAHALRAARRPEPPSLKEQAIAVLEDVEIDAAHYNILLRALEALPDD